MHDAELAQRAATGDSAAWSEIYDRYADRLHDYCWSILRDRHEAEDATHDAFVTAARKIGQLRDPALLRAWLYAICRNQALGRVRRRRRELVSEDVADMSPPAVEADRPGYEVAELRKLVWDAAGGLAPRDRSVLELHLRHGMEGTELAAALGTNAHHATVMLSRVREHVERSLGALLVGRTGRGACGELDTMLDGWDGSLSPLLRKRVARHIDNCEVCGEQRSRVVSPLALLSGVPLLPAPEYLREKVLADIALVTGDGPLDPEAAHEDDGPVAALRRTVREGRTGLIAGAAALTVLAVVGAALVSVGRKSEPTNLGIVGPSTSTSSAAATTARPSSSAPSSTTDAPTSTSAPTSSSAPPATVDVITGMLDFGTQATDAVLRFRNTGGRPLPWSVSSSNRAVTMEPFNGTLAAGQTTAIAVRLNRGSIPEGDFAAQLKLVAAGNTNVPVVAVENRAPTITDVGSTSAWLVFSSTTSCDSARASALVADDSAVTVVLSWQQGSGPVIEPPVSGSGGRYSGTIGPVTSANGNVRWWFTATDDRGNVTNSAEQLVEVRGDPAACPV